MAGKGGGAPSTLATWMIDDIKDLCERRREMVGMTWDIWGYDGHVTNNVHVVR